jgi:tripartite-type tricarboxylate transporter receptor subunit TctC
MESEVYVVRTTTSVVTSRALLPCFIRNALALLAFAAALGVAQAAEPSYPTGRIRLVVPYAAGGSSDVLARTIAPKLSDAMGQTWLVDNRTGAGGNLGTEIVARASADGYTVLMALDSTLTANPSLYKLPFSIEKDLQPVTLLGSADFMLIVHPRVQANTLKEFVALAKQRPGALNYASGGIGTPNHLATELLIKALAIDMKHIPYKGGGPAATVAMLAGEVEVQLGTVAATITYVTAGRLRALATTGARRSKLMPELPTVAESGYPGFEAGLWYALLVPATTPKSIVDRIRDDAINTLQYPDVQSALARQGLDPASSTPAELAARIKRETGIWAGVIQAAGIRVE